MKTLVDKVAVVTGASYGIGKALAITLAREGCDLVLIARDKDNLGETAKRVKNEGRSALVCPTDITDYSQVEAMVSAIKSKHNKVDILFNGAAIWVDSDLENTDPVQIKSLIETILTGTLWVTKSLLPLMEKSEEAHIVNQITDWGLPGSHGPAPFSAAKFGVYGFGQSFSKEAVKKGILVTNIFPGEVASTYDIDDDVDQVIGTEGNAKIPLSDMVNAVIFALKQSIATKIDTIVMTPSNADYGS